MSSTKDYIESLQGMSKQQLVLMVARQHLQENEGIAIVGTSCRFPGGIDDIGRFWQALSDARVVPAEHAAPPTDSAGRLRWNPYASDLAPIADLFDRGVYLDEIDLFTPERFGIGDEEALHMDPQQRLLLLCAARALEDAGPHDPSSTRVGVFAGVSTVEYPFAHLRNGVDAKELSPYMGTGLALSATAARIAVGLRLNGPVLTVDTACSSALTAVHLASAALRRGECDLAVVGACHLQLAPFTSAVFDRAEMLSRTGRSRPFTAEANGHVRGEGCGVLVLKRLRDAKADCDRPYAVIRGSSVYQHGDRAAMSAVPAIGQRRVMEQALRAAEIDPLDVQFVEAQANGSKVGGIIEVESTADAYRRVDPDLSPLYLGSCKANLGYLETASGAASLIKTALSLYHGEIPPQAGFDTPDPDIPWGRLAVRVPRERTPWPPGDRRLAGVSSFGFTGTNAHVLMEAFPEAPPRTTRPDAAARDRGRSYWPSTHSWT